MEGESRGDGVNTELYKLGGAGLRKMGAASDLQGDILCNGLQPDPLAAQRLECPPKQHACAQRELT